MGITIVFVAVLCCAAVPQITAQIQDNSTVCQLTNCDVQRKPWSHVHQLCKDVHGKLKGPCCLNGNFAIGVDIGQCVVSSLRITEEDQDHILLLNLSGSSISCSDPMITQLPFLQRVDLPDNCVTCPYPLQMANVTGKNACVTTEYLSNTCNATCPEHSECRKVATGLEHCVCLPGFHGYRCLKQEGFPSVTVFSTLSALTVCLSSVLWYTQRRHVIHS